ncbi:hypothetical protein PYCC9005_005625 [Savitreella phatthalungensis]
MGLIDYVTAPFEFAAGLWGLIRDPEMRYSVEVFANATDPKKLMKDPAYQKVNLSNTYN